MSVRVLDGTPCLIVRFPDDDVWEEPHYRDRVDAEEHVRELLDSHEEWHELVRIETVPEQCSVVQCDGCALDLAGQDLGVVHFGEGDDVGSQLTEQQWTTDGSGAHHCSVCPPLLAPVPVEQAPIPGL